MILNAIIGTATAAPNEINGIPEAGLLRITKPTYDTASLELVTGTGTYYASFAYNTSAPANSTMSAWTKTSTSGSGGMNYTISTLAAGAPSSLKSGDIWFATY